MKMPIGSRRGSFRSSSILSQMTATNEPITEIVMNSMITSPQKVTHAGIGDSRNSRPCLGRRLWHPRRGNFHRRRRNLA